MCELERYSVIDSKIKREFILLQGKGCIWKKCTFCDYHYDVSKNPYEINRQVLMKVTGRYGVLDIINSGSAMELDEDTLKLIEITVINRKIHTLWFEAHYLYREKLKEFALRFAPAKVNFRCGVESFDPDMRQSWNKGIPADVTPEQIAMYYKGVCLLVCTEGENRETIRSDIATAKKYFEYCSINVFCNNTTRIKRDQELARWFIREIYPVVKDDTRFEILLNNTDLGVG